MASTIPIPQQSQAMNQPMYIKQLEDIFSPPQPYTNNGFPHQGRELKPPNYAQLPTQPVPQNTINPDFLPFHVDFNRYIYNPRNGYYDHKTTYPIYTTGFSNDTL